MQTSLTDQEYKLLAAYLLRVSKKMKFSSTPSQGKTNATEPPAPKQ